MNTGLQAWAFTYFNGGSTGATAPHGSYFCEDDPGFVEGLVDSSVRCAALVLPLDFFFLFVYLPVLGL